MSLSNPHLAGVLLFAAGCGTTPGAASGVDASKADGGGVLDAGMDVRLPDDVHAEDRANSDSGTAPDAADSMADGPIGPAGPCVEGTSCSGSLADGTNRLFGCTCHNGGWSCDASLPSMVACLASSGPYILPSAALQPDGGCGGADLACTVPGQPGTICTCSFARSTSTTVGNWLCAAASETVAPDSGDVDAGAPSSVCGSFVTSDGGPASCTPGGACFTDSCRSLVCTCSANGSWSCNGAPWFDGCSCREQ